MKCISVIIKLLFFFFITCTNVRFSLQHNAYVSLIFILKRKVTDTHYKYLRPQRAVGERNLFFVRIIYKLDIANGQSVVSTPF